MWNKLFSSVDLMQTGLDASWMRNAVIRNNIANVETPGFKASDVLFEDTFAQALENTGAGMKVTRAKHMSGGYNIEDIEPFVVKNNGTSMRMDGNDVDIESENTKLAQNSVQYNTILYKLNSELARIKMAVNEGR